MIDDMTDDRRASRRLIEINTAIQ